MRHSKKAIMVGLIYGLLLFILCRLNLSGKLFLPNRPWTTDALGSVVATIVFILIGYWLLRLNPFNMFEKTALKNWKQTLLSVLIAVVLFEGLLIAKAFIIRQKPDIIAMVLSGLGAAVGILIAMALSQRKKTSSR